MIRKIAAIVCGLVLTFSLAGCGSTQSNTTSQSNGSTNQGSSMKGMKMDNQEPLSQAFQDELNGFTTIEQDVKKGDYASAQTLAGKLHDEFHAEILPPLKAEKGSTYAENIHSKYDELQDAVSSKDKTKIVQLIKVNRDNLNLVTKILGVSITK